MTQSLAKKTILVTGASRGIGLSIALKCASERAQVIVLTKDTQEQLITIENQLAESGGHASVLSVDITDYEAIQAAVKKAVDRFGGIDIVVNNTSATCFTDTLHTPPEKFDLVLATSARAAFFLAQICYPYLKKAKNPHIINISPPLILEAHWFKYHMAFSLAKYAMSLCTLGMAAEFAPVGIAVNSLWPQTTIATQTITDNFSPQVFAGSRWPSIMADAAYLIMNQPSHKFTGQFFTDEALLRTHGVTDFSHYAVDPSAPLMQALFTPMGEHLVPVSQDLFLR